MVVGAEGPGMLVAGVVGAGSLDGGAVTIVAPLLVSGVGGRVLDGVGAG